MDQPVKRGPGRPPKRGEPKRAPFQTRIRESLRDRLEAAADANGRSLSEEIEQRLEDSFDRLDKPFGGPAGLRVAIMLSASYLFTGGQLATANGHPDWTPDEWMADPGCFESALAALVRSVWTHHPEPVTREDYYRFVECLITSEKGRELTERMHERERAEQAAQADAA